MAERNDWYYWTHNQHCHFIQFRDCDDKVATATIFPLGERFVWKINGPCWSAYEKSGIATSLDEAKQAIDQQAMAIVAEEFAPEPVHPLG